MSIELRQLRWLWLSVVVISFDQLTKYLISAYLQPGQIIPIFPFFNLTLSYNQGAAFSLLADAGGWQLIFFSAISIMVSTILAWWLVKLPQTATLQALAIALIIGGALGNFVDRMYLGFVIDFLDFYYRSWHFATFNLADAAICVGATLLAITWFE